MKANTKLFALALIVLVALLGLTTLVSADSEFYNIIEVEVNDVLVQPDGDLRQVELSDMNTIEVVIEGTGTNLTCPSGDVTDCTVEAQVKAWIGGYEYDDVTETTALFDIDPNVTYVKILNLEFPSDLDVEDDNEYTLYVEIFDSKDTEISTYNIFAERPRHSLELVDVLVTSSVEAGDYIPVEVRVENLGDSKEEDIKVEADFAGMSSDATYLDELANFEVNNEDEESSESVGLTLYIPSDAVSGYYDLVVTVTYDKGFSTLTETVSVWVDGVEETTTTTTTEPDTVVINAEPTEADVTLSLATTDFNGVPGQKTSFNMAFANAGDAAETYVVSVNGISQWASSSVEPSVVVVGPGDSEEISISVTPDSDAAGLYQFTAQVINSDGELLEEVAMDMDVENRSASAGSSDWLKIAFVILIVLIILVGLILAFRKLKDEDDDDPLEPKDGKTYY